MHITLDDIPPVDNLPTPVPTATPLPISSPTPRQPVPMPSQIATALSFEPNTAQPVDNVPAPDLPIRLALVPILLVLGVTLVVQFLKKRKL
jgi:hypothetical protein